MKPNFGHAEIANTDAHFWYVSASHADTANTNAQLHSLNF